MNVQIDFMILITQLDYILLSYDNFLFVSILVREHSP